MRKTSAKKENGTSSIFSETSRRGVIFWKRASSLLLLMRPTTVGVGDAGDAPVDVDVDAVVVVVVVLVVVASWNVRSEKQL